MNKRFAIVLLSLLLIVTLSCTSTEGGHYTHEVWQGESQGLAIPWVEDAAALSQESGTLRFYFMSGEGQQMASSQDTKYGDSCLITFPGGEVMLIDGARVDYAPTLVENLRLLGIKRIDHLVLSHMHDDHYGGLISANGILANFEVGTMYINGTLNLKPTVVEKFDKAMAVFKPNLNILSQGDSFAIGDVAVDVFNPPADLIGKSFGTIAMNNTSLSLKFTYKDFSALFSGDIYIEAEYELIKQYASQLDVDLVKASHHGRNTSNSREWAQATTPKVVVATSGNAIDEIVYANYARSGARVFTDTLDGYVRVVSNGLDCITTTSRPRTDDSYAKYDLEASTKKKK